MVEEKSEGAKMLMVVEKISTKAFSWNSLSAMGSKGSTLIKSFSINLSIINNFSVLIATSKIPLVLCMYIKCQKRLFGWELSNIHLNY